MTHISYCTLKVLDSGHITVLTITANTKMYGSDTYILESTTNVHFTYKIINYILAITNNGQ